MSEKTIIFINDEASNINDLILNEELKIEELYKNIFTISISGEKLDWLVKTYSKYSHANKEMHKLNKLKNVDFVPKILISGITPNFFYNIISKAPGRDLYETIDEYGILPDKEIKNITINLLNILKKIHLNGIIHGDLKPENIIYDKNSGTVTIIDFEDKFTDDYRSPEQIIEKQLTPKSDLWSLGIVLFFLKTKRLPFKGERDILSKTLKFPKKFSNEFKNFLSCLLDRNIKSRFYIDEAIKHNWLSN